MADNRDMTFGLDFGLEKSIAQLGDIVGRLEQITAQAEQAEESGQQVGTSIGDAMNTATDSTDRFADALNDVTDSANQTGDAAGQIGTDAKNAGHAFEQAGAMGAAAMDEVAEATRGVGADIDEAENNAKAAFRSMGAGASSFGKAVELSMGTALKDGQSTAKGIQAGFQGALGFTENKFSSLWGNVKKGAKSIGTAIAHPIKTIKSGLGGALVEAGTEADNLGDAADDASKDLKDMGNAGSSAGSSVGDAIKGAVGAFIGLEAIKQGAELVKNFIGSALEAAGAAENVGAKFDAVFKDTDIGDWADNFGAAVHRSEAEIQGFLVSNKALYQGMGITGEAANDLSKVTTSLAYDFGNAFKMDDAEALSVIQDAVSSGGNALAEYGVMLDDATLKATAMSMGLGSNIDTLDDAAMAQVRLNSILEQTSGIQQSAINDTGGLVNSTKSLKGIWSDFMADAGSRFAPTLESLFGAIMTAWPQVEPMLFQLVDILSEGLQQAAPIMIELGGTLIPVLTSVLGTLFQAAIPLLSVFGDLAKTVLPPVAAIIGMLAETIMPPLVNILGTLNTAIIQPLVPVIQHLASALLPPLAQLLGVISPILEAMSPVLGVIGDVLGIIGTVLGEVIGFLADGAGKVVGFFTNLFGGAKDSKTEIQELNGAVSDLGTATDSIEPPVLDIPPIKAPVVEPIAIPQPEIPPVPPLNIPVNDITVPPIIPPQPDPVKIGVELSEIPPIKPPAAESITIPVNDIVVPPFDVPPVGAADTTAYAKSVSTAMDAAKTDTDKTWGQITDTTGTKMAEIGTVAGNTHEEIAEQSETMWQRMASAAEQGAHKIVAAFSNIGSAAASVSGANISVTQTATGGTIPHNEYGTNDFEGGWTHINEGGHDRGEMAFLPDNTMIVPDDKSEQLIDNMSGGQKGGGTFAPVFQIMFSGNPGKEEDRQTFMEQMEELVRKVYRECQESDYDERALNNALTT